MNYTTKGPRPDLLIEGIASQSALSGYAFPKLFHVVAQTEKGGTFSFARPNGRGEAGVVGRENGASLSAAAIELGEVSWGVVRYEGRAAMYEDDVKRAGGIENADRQGGRKCVRKAFNSIERAAIATFFSSARRTDAVELADGSVISILSDAADAVAEFGTPWLVCSTKSIKTLAKIPEVRAECVGTAFPQGLGNLLTVGGQKLADAIGNVIGLGGVIVFDSAIVGAAYDTYVGIVGLQREAVDNPADAIMVAKDLPVYGVALISKPDSAENLLDVSSWDDPENKRNVYDAEAQLKLQELNGADFADTPDPLNGAVRVFVFAEEYTFVGSNLVQRVQIVNDEEDPVVIAGNVTIDNAEPIEISGSVNSTVTPATGAVFTTATETATP